MATILLVLLGMTANGSDSFTASPNTMIFGRSAHTATMMPDGRVMVTGGSVLMPATITIFTVEFYNPATDTWSSTSGTMNTARQFHTATLLPSGKVLVAGGNQLIQANAFITTELYDSGTDTWTPSTHNMNVARSGHTATLLTTGPNAGKVLVAGGTSNGSTALSSVEFYDPATDTWTLSPHTMTIARNGHGATLLSNGKVLVDGGNNVSVELYDPSTDTWSSLSKTMNLPRFNHVQTLLPNNTVFVVGGFNGGKTAEIYTPNTPPADSWNLSNAMETVTRTGNSATLLTNGKVLIAGGGSPPGTVEIYNPGTTVTPLITPVASSNNQTATTGTPVAIAPAVQLTYPSGANVGAGFSVTFALVSGGGMITGATAQTDAYGIATLGSWTIGAGTNMLTVTSSTAPLATAATITATGVSNVPTTITINAGNNQSATVNTKVGSALSVMVKDQFGAAIFDGAAVTFTVSTGAGTVGGGNAITSGGIATLGSWTLGTIVGTNTLTVTSGLVAPSVIFTATSTPDVASTMSVSAGNSQSATVNTNVPVKPAALVKDRFGNIVADNTAVIFAIATGGGAVSGGNALTTNGIATLGNWQLGKTSGSNSLNVTSGAATTSFSATATPDIPFSMTISAGNNQSAIVNTNVTTQPSVLVKDQFTTTP